MLAFYRDVPADGCEPDHDLDMLLYQWGTYDWGQGLHFECDITRQLIPSPAEEDEDIWQLSLTYRLPPTDELRAIGKGNRWCRSMAELDAFQDFMVSHPAYSAVAERLDAPGSVTFGQAG